MFTTPNITHMICIFILIFLPIICAKRKVGIVLGDKWNSDTYAVAHHTFFIYDTIERSTQWKPIFLISNKTLATKKILKHFDKNYSCQYVWDFSNIEVVIEAGGAYPGNPKEKHPHIKFVYFNQGPSYFTTLTTIANNEEMATHFTHRRDAIWATPQYKWQAPFLSEWMRTDQWNITPYVWRPVRLRQAASYKKGNARRVGVYETNRGVYKMSMIPIMIGNRAFRQDNTSIEYFETPAMRHLYTDEFTRLLDHLELTIVAQKDIVQIPKQFEDKQIGTILSHHMKCGLNYLYLEALYLNMSLVHNSKFIQDCGYYYSDFDVEEGAQVLRHAMDTHDDNIDAYAKASATCLWRYAPENPRNIRAYDNLLNNLFIV